MEQNYTCNNKVPNFCDYECGNGILKPDLNEECDDGNNMNMDGCDSKCKVEPGFVCKIS